MANKPRLREDQLKKYTLKPAVRNDPRILSLLLDANDALRTFGSHEFRYADDDHEACLQHWLLYLGSLLAMVSDAVAMMAMHRSSLAASCVQRQAVEYVAKSLYFDRNLEEAWFQYHFGTRDRLALLRDLSREDSEEYALALRAFDEALAKCPEIATRKPVRIDVMMMALSDGKRDSYANLIRYPSQLLHASALGMSQILQGDDGRLSVTFQVRKPESDALLLELAHYIVLFGEVFDRRVLGGRFAKQWAEFQTRCELELIRHERRYDRAIS